MLEGQKRSGGGGGCDGCDGCDGGDGRRGEAALAEQRFTKSFSVLLLAQEEGPLRVNGDDQKWGRKFVRNTF